MAAACVLIAINGPNVSQESFVQVAEAAPNIDSSVTLGQLLHGVAGISDGLEDNLQEQANLGIQCFCLRRADAEEHGIKLVCSLTLSLSSRQPEVPRRVSGRALSHQVHALAQVAPKVGKGVTRGKSATITSNKYHA